jgi:hypothetical protein
MGEPGVPSCSGHRAHAAPTASLACGQRRRLGLLEVAEPVDVVDARPASAAGDTLVGGRCGAVSPADVALSSRLDRFVLGAPDGGGIGFATAPFEP